MAAQLAASPVLAEREISVLVHVNTQDLYRQNVHGPVTEKMTQASLTAQLQLERTWSRFLQRPATPRRWAITSARWLKRASQFVRSPGPEPTKRLINIELSHLELLRQGLASGADWIMILEDDAFSPDVSDCASGIAAIITSESPRPKYVNISQSFTSAELGISHLLSPVSGAVWHGPTSRRVQAAERPVTNTVCAIFYRVDFASELLSVMECLPMEPVVPIDWKLNQALMDMYSTGDIGAGDCWLVDPAPIVQMSMRSGGMIST